MVGFMVIDIVLRALRWRVLLRPVADVPFRHTLPANLVGYLANNILPARLGELVRTDDLGVRSGVPRSTILGTIVVERVVDTVVLVAIASIAILVLSVRGIVASAVLVGLAVTALLIVGDRDRDRGPPAARRGARRRRSSIAGRRSARCSRGCARA